MLVAGLDPVPAGVSVTGVAELVILAVDDLVKEDDNVSETDGVMLELEETDAVIVLCDNVETNREKNTAKLLNPMETTSQFLHAFGNDQTPHLNLDLSGN